METEKNGGTPEFPAGRPHPPLLFVVLVPHRDCFPALEAYRRNLFASGFDGACSFPAAAPLALLSRPLEPGELKSAAAETRKLLGGRKIVSAGEDERGGWTSAGDSPHTVRFFGLRMDMPVPAFPGDAVTLHWEKPILAPAIIYGAQDRPGQRPAIPRGPAPENRTGTDIAFRAAALANMALTPVPEMDYSYTWKTGPLFWLPR